MGGYLKRLGLPAVPQLRVPRAKSPRRNFYLDFGFPKVKVAIECDGAAYHSTSAQKRYDARRQAELEAMGWRVLRFTGSEIVTDIDACGKQILDFLAGKP
jgi:very-short-patch-repair endonuclease